MNEGKVYSIATERELSPPPGGEEGELGRSVLQSPRLQVWSASTDDLPQTGALKTQQHVTAVKTSFSQESSIKNPGHLDRPAPVPEQPVRCLPDNTYADDLGSRHSLKRSG